MTVSDIQVEVFIFLSCRFSIALSGLENPYRRFFGKSFIFIALDFLRFLMVLGVSVGAVL